MIASFLLYLALGAVAGTAAGLFGIGGGAIIVPILVLSFRARGFGDSVLMQLALGTSLASIIVTGASSVRAHHLLGNVVWPVVLRMAFGIVGGTLLGSVVAGHLDGALLIRVFTLFLVFVAIKMAWPRKPPSQRESRSPGISTMLGTGGAIGFVSALFGIGGGTMSVPFLNWLGLEMKQAVGTAAACGLPIAVSGAIGYAVMGWAHPDLPSYCVGYLYLPAWLGIILASSPSARWGARLAHRLPEQWLRRAFSALVMAIVLKLWFSASVPGSP